MTGDTHLMDLALDRLAAAYRGADLPPIQPPAGVDAVLAQIRAQIAPLRLPAELERFWQRVDPGTVAVAPYPNPASPAFALTCWTAHRDEFPGMTPRILFPVAYESHGFLFVELEDGHGSGGAVLEWAYANSQFSVRFPNLTAYVDLLATMIEHDEMTTLDGTSWVQFDPDGRWEDALTVRLSAAQPLPGFGHARELDDDVRTWPEHWLAADGLPADRRPAHGTTTTITELLHRVADGTSAVGTIRARVEHRVGSAAGSRVTVDDGTGELDVWCPAAVFADGPTVGQELELDVVVRPLLAPPPEWTDDHRDVQTSALAGTQSAAAALHDNAFRAPAAAEATAIRPAD